MNVIIYRNEMGLGSYDPISTVFQINLIINETLYILIMHLTEFLS